MGENQPVNTSSLMTKFPIIFILMTDFQNDRHQNYKLKFREMHNYYILAINVRRKIILVVEHTFL